ncbi:MAG TPA: hypothetical protein HPP94_08180 [Desulfuromonadales bacterium]|nr:hypothetical protein [Desulfuromonadales bacterium]
MKGYTAALSVGAIILIVLLFATLQRRAPNRAVMFSTHLFPKFQSKGCTTCHDFFEKKLDGLALTTHRELTAEKCVECHDKEVTGFARADDWFARPGLYTSDMNALQTCETIKREMHVQFKHRGKAARDMTEHLLTSPRVLWGIAGATPKSGKLPKGRVEKELVQGGLKQWEADVTAWIQGGMECN